MKNGFYLLVVLVLSSCSNMGSCDRFNIDSYELMTGLDVPKVTHVNCFEDERYRTTAFSLDNDNLADSERYGNIEGYYNYFNFSSAQVAFTNDQSVGVDLSTMDSVLYRSGESKNHYWRAAVVPSSSLLVLEAERKDEE